MVGQDGGTGATQGQLQNFMAQVDRQVLKCDDSGVRAAMPDLYRAAE